MGARFMIFVLIFAFILAFLTKPLVLYLKRFFDKRKNKFDKQYTLDEIRNEKEEEEIDKLVNNKERVKELMDDEEDIY